MRPDSADRRGPGLGAGPPRPVPRLGRHAAPGCRRECAFGGERSRAGRQTVAGGRCAGAAGRAPAAGLRRRHVLSAGLGCDAAGRSGPVAGLRRRQSGAVARVSRRPGQGRQAGQSGRPAPGALRLALPDAAFRPAAARAPRLHPPRPKPRRPRIRERGRRDFLAFFAGAARRPRFLPDATWRAPSAARWVDDIRISGMLALNAGPIRVRLRDLADRVHQTGPHGMAAPLDAGGDRGVRMQDDRTFVDHLQSNETLPRWGTPGGAPGRLTVTALPRPARRPKRWRCRRRSPASQRRSAPALRGRTPIRRRRRGTRRRCRTARPSGRPLACYQ